MNSITRLSIIPFLISCISTLGCTVFYGQQQDDSSPRQQADATIKLLTDAREPDAHQTPKKAVIRELPKPNKNSRASILNPQQNKPTQPPRIEDNLPAAQNGISQNGVTYDDSIRLASHLSNETGIGPQDSTLDPSAPPPPQDSENTTNNAPAASTTEVAASTTAANNEKSGVDSQTPPIDDATKNNAPEQPQPISDVQLSYSDIDGNSQGPYAVVPNQSIRARPKGTFTIAGKMPAAFATDSHYAMLLIDGALPVSASMAGQKFTFESASMPLLGDGPHTLSVYGVDKTTGQRIPGVAPFNFEIKNRSSKVSVQNVDANSFLFSATPRIKVTFDTGELTSPTASNFKLIPLTESGTEGTPAVIPTVQATAGSPSVELGIGTAQPPGTYRLRISGITDLYRNTLAINNTTATAYDFDILKPVGGETPSVRPGISGSTGPYVPYPEFARRPDVPDGFNPNDKVETRVVRLYFYRDAHRIAQIVNREVKSYNRAAVDTSRQLADKARNLANEQTVARQASERAAIQAATKTRQAENDLQRAENSLNGSLQQLTQHRRKDSNADPEKFAEVNDQLESLVSSFTQQVNDLRSQVQNLRDSEVQANEQAQQAEAQEKLAREEQFRREVAAAHSDPDTYVPGKVGSIDPVEQVSISVVGEGLIQLRGPLKGINLIRTAIDQLDSPVGQVRISLHTVQINGERADRMEKVAKEVQTYIDHSRFMTMQSAEMLRKAVVQVASQKAEEASGLFPGETQLDRDQRYIVAFFGKDFIDELRAMDSEFLHTGNKLLSLHSMDTTSLASALNLMALAKNSTRQEIFAVFDSMLQSQLPQAEMNYFAAGWTCPKKKQNRFHRCHKCEPAFCPLACNAKFESLRGFFDMQIYNDDTMTPLQREFIRLAQIFKSRLITEMEYKQRVMERAIIEERLGNRTAELQAAKDKEVAAIKELKSMQDASIKGRVNMIKLIKEIEQGVQAAIEGLFTDAKAETGFLYSISADLENNSSGEKTINEEKVSYELASDNGAIVTFDNQTQANIVKKTYDDLITHMREIHANLQLLATIQNETRFNDDLKKLKGYLDKMRPLQTEVSEKDWKTEEIKTYPNSVPKNSIDFVSNINLLLNKLSNPIGGGRNVLLDGLSDLLSRQLGEILPNLASRESAGIENAYKSWLGLKKTLRPLIQSIPDADLKNELEEKVSKIDIGFSDLFGNGFLLANAENQAKKSRRPLDHKKFLDMLIDDLEEKYIELLDGTRAHVANIDNYLKRVTTALDDDFNTQFYYPAFKYIRESSVSYDVQFGQTETTTLLANNREFAKADPSATMEFDLPKRDILIAEGINSAKALMSDVGALANDPTFLAMASLGSPNSAASPNAGSTGGNGVVRNVLPGLGGTTSEQMMSQNSNGGQQFGSNLENLIPDPAVYKFETGTGFEIRPVIQPDGQAVVFDFNYMYTTNIREPVRADEKHLGRVKRHFVDTDVQLSNFELREVSRYTVALKAARTARGVPLLEDVPGLGVLFRPLPSDENSLQQNLIMAQATIFPTLFDLMGLRWAPVVADLDPMKLSDSDFVVRNRHRMLENRVYDESSTYVDEFLRIPEGERRMDLYRSQETVPYIHPNGYMGPGMNLQDSQIQEGYQPSRVYPNQQFVPGQSIEGAPYPTYRNPPPEFYEQNESTMPPDPNGIREPGITMPYQGR